MRTVHKRTLTRSKQWRSESASGCRSKHISTEYIECLNTDGFKTDKGGSANREICVQRCCAGPSSIYCPWQHEWSRSNCDYSSDSLKTINLYTSHFKAHQSKSMQPYRERPQAVISSPTSKAYIYLNKERPKTSITLKVQCVIFFGGSTDRHAM